MACKNDLLRCLRELQCEVLKAVATRQRNYYSMYNTGEPAPNVPKGGYCFLSRVQILGTPLWLSCLITGSRNVEIFYAHQLRLAHQLHFGTYMIGSHFCSL